jgi:hypothetical protein
MGGSDIGDDARLRNESTGSIGGHSVQAGEIHGDVHFHQDSAREVLVPRQLPGTVQHFVNRAVEQDVLTTLLNGAKTDGAVLLSTIDGVAGVGKSTFVVHWAHQTRERFPDGELYVNLRGFDPAAEPMTPGEALAEFLAALDIPPERIPTSADARAALFRSSMNGKRMLVLLDNARSADQVRPLLPANPGCLVLVTSRNRLDELVIRDGATRLTLDVLARQEAYELLARYLGAERLESEPDAVDSLTAHCAGLPLALGIVAVRAAENADFPLDDLVDELQNEQERLDALDAGGETGVRAVFSWSYHALSPGAARLFRLLGLPTGPDISLAAAADLAGATQRETRKLLAELTRTHLLEQHKPGRYRFHDLLRAYATECATNDERDEDRQTAIVRLLDHYLQTNRVVEQQLYSYARTFTPEPPASDIPGLTFADDEAALSWWEVEWPNLVAATRQAVRQGLHVHAWQLPMTLMVFSRLRGHMEEWIAICGVALDSARRLADREAEAHLLADLALAYSDRGQYDISLRHLEIALALLREVGDRDRECTVLITLGEECTYLQQYERAAEALRAGLTIAREIGNPYAQGAAHTGLGLLQAKFHQFDEAFAHLHEALRLFRDVGERFGEGFVLNNLADAYVHSGRLDDALATYRQAVAHRREIGHRQGEAISLRGLGKALRDSGDTEGARECWQQALALLEELGLPEGDEVRFQLSELPS